MSYNRRIPSSEKKSLSISLICGIIYLVLGIAVRIMAKSPYEALHRIDSDGILPPLWIFNILSLSVCFLCGIAAGQILEQVMKMRPAPHVELYACKGTIFYICLLFLSLLWYPAFFVAESLFLTVISLISIFLLCLCTSYMWSRVRSSAAFIILLSSAWYFYTLIIMLMIMINN